MGVGLRLHAMLQLNGNDGFVNSVELLDRLSAVASSFSKSREMGMFFLSAKNSDTELALTLHPAEEPARFFVEDGVVVCDARTSTCGHGYHVYLVDLLDDLSATLELNWTAGHGEGDDTDYFFSRDEGRVESEMKRWLRAICQHVGQMDRQGATILGLDLSFNSLLTSYGQVATGRGFKSFDEIEAAGRASDDEFDQYYRAWFVWPSKATDSDFWLRTGEVLLWQFMPWHAPIDQSERDTFDLTCDCFEHARRIDPAAMLPELALLEMKRLGSSDITSFLKPAKIGPGYYRQLMTRPVPGNWRLELPGYWYCSLEDEVSYWFGGITVWASVLTITTKDGSPPGIERYAQLIEDKGPFESLKIDHRLAKWKLDPRPEGADSPNLLNGYVLTDTDCLVLSIYFDLDSDIEFAKSIVTTAQPPLNDQNE